MVTSLETRKATSSAEFQPVVFDAEMAKQMNSYAMLGWEFVRTDSVTESEKTIFRWREKRHAVLVFRRPLKVPAEQATPHSGARDFHARETRPMLRLIHSAAE